MEGSQTLDSDTVASRIAAMIDHTLLKPDATAEQVTHLCDEARRYQFASVCINPVYVPLARSLLADTRVPICTVVAFPLGATPTPVKVYETEQAIADGAAEIDMVMDIGALKSGANQKVEDDIALVARACHAGNALLKVIIEAALLTDSEKVVACEIAQAAGADYVKTSTGFGPGGATVDDVALMRRTVGSEMGVKAAGGIRTCADAKAMIEAGATRLGASAGVKIVEDARAAANG